MRYCPSCPSPTRLEPASGAARCAGCGHEEPAALAPLLIVTGASGSGKSTLVEPLARELAGQAAVFDIDALIDPLTVQADGAPINWGAVRAAWLEVASALAAGGLPTVLLGPLAPYHFDELAQARWVASMHFLLLDCSDVVRRERLEARPPWRGRERERAIAEQTQWGVWLREHIHHGVDTSRAAVDDTVRSVAGWVRSVISTPARWQDDATLAAAVEAARLGKIESWVHDYLHGAGRNVPMVRGLRRRARWWIGPVEAPAGELRRIVGPEPAMAYPRTAEDWEPRLAGIERSIRAGWDAPPIIVDACAPGVLLVADGNHRFEAQRRMDRQAVWAILFFDDEAAWRGFERPWATGATRSTGAAP